MKFIFRLLRSKIKKWKLILTLIIAALNLIFIFHCILNNKKVACISNFFPYKIFYARMRFAFFYHIWTALKLRKLSLCFRLNVHSWGTVQVNCDLVLKMRFWMLLVRFYNFTLLHKYQRFIWKTFTDFLSIQLCVQYFNKPYL